MPHDEGPAPDVHRLRVPQHGRRVARGAARRAAGRTRGRPRRDRRSSDRGREAVSTQSSDRRAFKTATLRDLPRRGPYMHDGAFGTLGRRGPLLRAPARRRTRARTTLLRPFEASDEDVADLVAFLESLNGDERPGPGAPLVARACRAHPRAARRREEAAARRASPWGSSPRATSCPGAGAPREVARGRHRRQAAGSSSCLRAPPTCGSCCPTASSPSGGGLVPDSCARARGRGARSTAGSCSSWRSSPGAAAPPSLAAEHEGTMRLPGHPAPRTVLHRVADRDAGRASRGFLRGVAPDGRPARRDRARSPATSARATSTG